MKKMLIVGMLVLGLALGGNAWACPNGNCMEVDSSAVSMALDMDGAMVPAGGAFGVSGAIAGVEGGAAGCILDGSVGADIQTTAGALTDTNAYRGITIGYHSFGDYVGSSSVSHANELASLYTTIGGFMGTAAGGYEGVAAQGTMDISGMSDGPFIRMNGVTGGVASQGSVGVIGGDAVVGVFLGGANAQSTSAIVMDGSSLSESYRNVEFGNGSVTETMGNVVGANTVITSYGAKSGNYCGSHSDFNGGYVAEGNVASTTVIQGGAAHAVGTYQGAGVLNSSYNGSAFGGTIGSRTTVNGMNGSVVSTGASMSVTSTHNSNVR